MKIIKLYFLGVLILFITPAWVMAETIHLNDGRSVEGRIIERNAKSIKVDIDGGLGRITYYSDEITDIDGQPFRPPKPVVIHKYLPQEQSEPSVSDTNKPLPIEKPVHAIDASISQAEVKIGETQAQEVRVPQAQAYARQPHSYSRTRSSSNRNKDIGYAFYGLIFGVYAFFHGLLVFRKKRLLESIPASTVRGLAMGLVELNGKAKKTKVLQSPLTGTECTFYRYTVERYESSGRSGRWVIIAKGDSVYCPFGLDDGTGQVLVMPNGAEFVMPADFTFTTGLSKTMPDNLVSFMENDGLKYKGLFGTYSLRFNEWYIKHDEPVFVAGTALKRSSQEEVELNLQDGTLDVVIAKGDGQVFIVSDESQKDVLKDFSWKALGGIWGGAILSLATLAYLLFRFGLWAI